jgi:CheY-like chemotaxis protein
MTSSDRVLVVDDELHVRELLRDFLTNVGDEVVTAAAGAEALEVCERSSRTSSSSTW